MNSKGGMDIKGNRRRALRIERSRKRTKEEIREGGEGEEEKTSWVHIALSVMVCLCRLASRI